MNIKELNAEAEKQFKTDKDLNNDGEILEALTKTSEQRTEELKNNGIS